MARQPFHSLAFGLVLLPVPGAWACSVPEETGGGGEHGTETGGTAGGAGTGETFTGGTAGGAGTRGRVEETLPDPVPSRQTVHFAIHNGTGDSVGVQVAGDLCSAFEIWRVDGEQKTLVQREADWALALCCVHVACDDDEVGTFESIGSGATLMLTWDAREEEIFWRNVPCPEGTSDASNPVIVVEVPVGVARPVEPGSYEAVFMVGAGPEDCSGWVTDNRYECRGYFDYYGTGEACTYGGQPVRVAFALPESGDVTVPVELAP